MMENVMHFFAEAWKRLKKLLDNLDGTMGLKKKPSTKAEKPPNVVRPQKYVLAPRLEDNYDES